MTFLTGFAIYFIIWWVTLFVILPIGVRTQAEEQDVTLGTTESAPLKLRMGRKLIWTSIVSAVVFGIYVLLTVVFGLSVDSIPRFIPDLSKG